MSAETFQGWADRVERLCLAEQALEGVARAMGLHAPQGAWHEALFAKLRPQLARSPFLVVAVTGGTNTGKSSIFNNLLGTRVSRVTATAMGSKHPVCILPRGFRDLAELDRVFPGFSVRPWSSDEDPLLDTPENLLFYREDPGGLLPDRLVLLDTPDVDGSLSGHWERARLVRGASDVLLGVLTQQKHNDAAIRRFFSEAARAEKVVFVAFNMVQWPDDQDDCEHWLDVFRAGTGVNPEHVYVAPHDRKAAEALELPFLGLEGTPKDPVRDLADLHFSEIKVRTFRGSLRQVLDPAEGLPAFLRSIEARAGDFAGVSSALADGLRVEIRPPTLPGQIIVNAVHDWLRPQRTRFDRAVHGAYGKLGRLVLTPFTRRESEAEDDYKKQELTVLFKALEAVLDRLEEIRRLGDPLLKTELDRILSGEGREATFRTLTDRHAAAKVLSLGYEEFIQQTLDRFRDDSPRLMKTIQFGLIATAAARPVLTLMMFGSPFVASELAFHAMQTGIQVAGELAVGTAVTVGTEGAAATLRKPVVNLLTRLFTRFYEERAALLVAILHESVLGRGIDRIAALSRAATCAPFLEARMLVESLGRDLA